MLLSDSMVETAWAALQQKLTQLTGKERITTEAMLLLIGLREIGIAPKDLSKEEKRDLLHVGMCTVLCDGGYYKRTHIDIDGWPHFELLKPVPNQDVFAQALFMRQQIVSYFMNVYEDLLRT